MKATPHIEVTEEGKIAKTVLMPGDPLRAEYIAKTYLENVEQFNHVRGMNGYTGTYKGKQLTVMASGMGMPSMGIYSYELFKFYDVQNIIRIGSCGGYLPNANLFDIILAKNVFSESNFALTLNNDVCHEVSGSEFLNSIISETAKKKNINLFEGNTVCTDCFDVYMTDVNKFLARIPEGFNPVSAEMEAFALFYLAKYFNKKASCLLTVVDSYYKQQEISSEEREKSLNSMIKLGLESALFTL